MLTQEQLIFFDENGYLVVDDVLDQGGVLEPVRAEYAELLSGLYDGWYADGLVTAPPESLSFEDKLVSAYRAGCDWFQSLDISLPGDRIEANTPMHFGPAVFDMITNSNLLNLVEDLIGPDITSNPIQHVRIKPPAVDLRSDEIRAHVTKTDWHQDRGVALAEADETDIVTVWIAVTDATVENGCLTVVPKAHKTGMLPHCPKVQTAIADGFVDEATSLPLPVKSGGVIILHPLLPHASLPNLTQNIRWSFDLRFNPVGQPTGRAHFPDFVARSRAKPETELRDWRVWKKSWENARHELACGSHVDIHRWTSDAPYCA
jgi:phytanoyl-CoA hydroxylase